MTPKIIAQAEGHVLTIELLRQQCEVVAFDADSDGTESHPDDALLLGYLDAAVSYAEDFTGRSIALRTYEVALSAFPQSSAYPAQSLPIEIPLPPLVEIINFQSGEDSDGPVDPDAYVIDDYSQPARLVAVGSWPAGTFTTNAIKLRYRAGYSSEDSDAQPLPLQIRQALLLIVGDWYKNREDTVEGSPAAIPNGAMALLRPLRVRIGMA